MPNHLFDLIRNAAQEEAFFIETGDGKRYTYGDMLALSGRIANLLRDLNLAPGDRVVVQTEKSPEVVALYLGTLRAGAIYLPLNTGYTPAEMDYFIHDSEPALIVVAPGKYESIRAMNLPSSVRAVLVLNDEGSGSLMEQAASKPASFTDCPRGEDDIAAILYTSGTTGRSKGAMLSHGNLASNAITLVREWRFTSGDVLLHALPIFHTHGLFVAINTTLLAGGAMLFMKNFDADEILRLMPRATAMMGVPTFYVRLLKSLGLTKEATAHMRLFVSGSAPLLAETHIEWTARTGHAILERYGMTETNMNTSNPYDGARIAGTVGPALPGIDVRITDPATGAPLKTGEIGMIEIRGPNVFKGYWRNPEKTRSEFRDDGFFISGDLGRVDDNGYFTIVGRNKDLIISGGYNVYPKEVESEIDSMEGIVESAVIGVPHPDFGEAVFAVAVRKNGVTLDEDAVLSLLQGRLARYKNPKRVVFVDDLPRNTMGKVIKAELRSRFEKAFQ